MKIKARHTIYLDLDGYADNVRPKGKLNEDYSIIRKGTIMETVENDATLQELGVNPEEYHAICVTKDRMTWLGFAETHDLQESQWFDICEE